MTDTTTSKTTNGTHNRHALRCADCPDFVKVGMVRCERCQKVADAQAQAALYRAARDEANYRCVTLSLWLAASVVATAVSLGWALWQWAR